MKRQFIPRIVILTVMSLFFSLNIYAQSGTGELPGAKPAPTPTPRPAASRPTKSTTPSAAPVAAPVSPLLIVGEEKKSKLEPKSSDKSATGSLYEDLVLMARSEDLLTISLECANPISLQILDKDGAEVAIARNPSGDFKINTPTGGLPVDGEYRVRITGAAIGKNAIPYSLKVNRLGLTPISYAERFQKIYANYRESDPTSVDETIAKFEELGKDDSTRPTTFEMLGIVYLYGRKDAAKAEVAMEQALKTNGAAVVKISFDGQWRRMSKLKSGSMGFEDARMGWLRIRPGQLSLTDLSNRSLASLNGLQIKELSKSVTAAYNLVSITADNPRKPYVFAPGSLQLAEADLIIKLIQNHVMGKTN